jgi:hypothetical protein
MTEVDARWRILHWISRLVTGASTGVHGGASGTNNDTTKHVEVSPVEELYLHWLQEWVH